jgi:membrane protein YqaA with SNARE-associated domain
MGLKLSENPKQDFTEYDDPKKRITWIVLTSISVIFGAILLINFIFLKKFDLFGDTWVLAFMNHINTSVTSLSALGMFYIFFFGGLILLFLPVDPIYILTLTAGKFTLFHAFAMFFGLGLAYTVNYLIGYKLSAFSKHIISPKNFYKSKVMINKYGKWGIFFINLIGVGSQQLMFVLGVFRYNWLRLFLLSFPGQLLRALAIAALVLIFHIKIPFT